MFDETLNIQTPENITFDYEVAGIGSRFLAAGIDYSIIGVILFIIYIAVFAAIATTLDFSVDALGQTLTWVTAVISLIAFAVNWGYFILFEVLWNGQSPGKRFINLRVIRADGTPITPFESTIRNLVRVVDFLPGFYGLGVVTMFVNRQSRRLGDLAAGTLVVWEKSGDVRLVETPTEERKALPMDMGDSELQKFEMTDLPTEKLLSEDFIMAEGYLQRKDSLADPVSLGRSILASLFVRLEVGLPLDIEDHQVEPLIREIVQARQGE